MANPDIFWAFINGIMYNRRYTIPEETEIKVCFENDQIALS